MSYCGVSTAVDMESKPLRILTLDGERRAVCYGDVRSALDAEWIDGLAHKIFPPTEDVDIALLTDEFWHRSAYAVCELRRRGIPTLHVADGITEWRNTWENPRSWSEDAGMPLMQPLLADKFACLGRSQARVLESWGNLGKCEVVGAPRLDNLLGRKPRERDSREALTFLIATANTPAFTPAQEDACRRSLVDLRDSLASAANLSGRAIEARWRIDSRLAAELDVETELSQEPRRSLAESLPGVDAVITTPSTVQLEAMLQGVPLALLDYNNCPRYVPAAWTITAREHLAQAISEMTNPSPAKMLYQDTVLHDALECRTPATPRLGALIRGMAQIGRECRQQNSPLTFPVRMLADEFAGHHLPEEKMDLRSLYPDHPVFGVMDVAFLQTELGHLRKELVHATWQNNCLVETHRRAIAGHERAIAVNERAVAVNERVMAMHEQRFAVHEQTIAEQRRAIKGLKWQIDAQQRAIAEQARRLDATWAAAARRALARVRRTRPRVESSHESIAHNVPRHKAG